ncbi:hypothetical protein [Tardiphaga sp.]|uniref:hypothetical protein n=1 Tax=Tardiphaga sp. TaxID=1926292 RepID=UPI0025E38F0C|nr:hypothetical protein [Tardiphaga sp.]
MSTPAAPQLNGYRVIPRGMQDADGFMAALTEKYIDADYRVAAGIWDMVYDRCRDLPPTVADPSSY